ncbi:flagellar hook-length control protein FliK [Maritalea sp. S77]|uniref:flagellar hook-length control protein FliK n=1 Tax=Maritalea sp. S77 TaxID=3415125 RepID=UPI003C7A8F88
MQIGLQNTPKVDFIGFPSDTKGTLEGKEDAASGFEAILDALMGGDASDMRAALHMKAEMGPVEGNAELAVDMSKIKDALEKLKEALAPIGAAFDQLLVPDPQQIANAQDAFAALASAINNHPMRNDAAVSLPMGMYTDQLGALRQAEDAKAPGNLMQLGKLLKRLDTLLGDVQPNGKGQPSTAQLEVDINAAAKDGEQGLTPKDNAKLSLNIHQMIGRLEELSEKLPETAQAAIAKLVDKKAGQLTGADGEQNTDPMAKILASGEEAGTKKALQNGSASNLISAALEGKEGETKFQFGQNQQGAGTENKLMAGQTYAAQRPAPTLAQQAKMASDLDTTDTITDKILNLQRTEQQHQSQIQIDKVAHQQAPQKQINLPAMAFEVVRQIRNGAQRFEIRLDPPEMGKIDVQLEMEGKNVTARLTVERAETLDLLQRDQRALERALQQAGLNTDKANLQFSLKQDQNGGQGQQFGQENGQQANLNGDNDAANSDTQSITENPSLVLRGTARPDGLNLWV